MAGKRYAILIGNGKFNEPDLPSLRCPERDVSDLAKLLESPIHGPYQVDPLINQTSGTVLDTIFEVLVHKATRDDVVLVYYSGHGKLDHRGHLYWTTADTRTNRLPRTSIPAQTVVGYMDESRSLSKILIVDCCFSGAIASALTQRGNANDQVAQALRRELKGHGFYVLTASSDVQTAEEKEGDEYGLLTKHIINGILSGDADENDDGLVSMHELSLYVQKQVEAESSQSPKAWSAQTAHGDLAIARTASKRQKRLDAIFRAIPLLRDKHSLSSNVAVAVIRELNRREELSDDSREKQDELIDLLYSNLSSPDRLATVIYGVFYRKIKDSDAQLDIAIPSSIAREPTSLRKESDKSLLEDLMLQAEIFLQYSQREKAVERLQKLRVLFPGEEQRNNALRKLMVMAGLIPEDQLDDSGEDDPTVSHNLGIAFKEMGLIEEAMQELKKAAAAFERGHKYTDILATYQALAECSRSEGALGAAIQWYEQALRLPGLDTETRLAITASLRACTEQDQGRIRSDR